MIIDDKLVDIIDCRVMTKKRLVSTNLPLYDTHDIFKTNYYHGLSNIIYIIIIDSCIARNRANNKSDFDVFRSSLFNLSTLEIQNLLYNNGTSV